MVLVQRRDYGAGIKRGCMVLVERGAVWCWYKEGLYGAGRKRGCMVLV